MSYGKLSSNGIDLTPHSDESTLTKLERYRAFVKRKAELCRSFGFQVEDSEINPILKPHQRVSVRWGVAGGRRAWFEAFGLGKTVIQLESLRLVIAKAKAGKPGLIVAPLGVRQEFKRDAHMLGIPISFIRSVSEVNNLDGIYLTNYETVRDGKLDPSAFGVTSLDEAAVLRGFGGTKTFREFMVLFETVPYRFVATATPDPNEYIELLAYSAYLGIMDVSQAKTRFFKRDSTKADVLTIHPHKVQEFWLWVATWALFLQKPSDLGPEYSDEGYDIPELEVIHHEIRAGDRLADADRGGQYRLIRDASLGVVDAAREKRDSISERVEVMIQIVRSQSVHEEVVSKPQGPGAEAEFRMAQGPCGGDEGLHETVEQNEGSGKPVGLLRKEQRKDHCQLPGLEGSESREIQRADQEVFGKQSRETPRTAAPMACEQQRTVEFYESKEQTTPVWSDTGSVRRDANSTVGLLLNLSGANEETGSGSLSQNREGTGSALPGLQCGDRIIAGQRGGSGTRGWVYQKQFIVWCDLNAEQRQIENALEDAEIEYSSLDGSMDIEDREILLEQWRRRETQAFISKPTMYGAGVNLQQCAIAIFMGIGFKFAEFLQSIKRIHRFLQTKRVQIHLVYTDNERGVLAKLMRKWEQYKVQVEKMTELIREYGLSELSLVQALARSEDVQRCEILGEGYTLVHNDSVAEMIERLGDSSIQLILTSPAFANMYEYSPHLADFGHTDNPAHFWEQMAFIIPEMLRVLEPGRLACIHVKDRIVPGGLTGLGFQTVYPFHVDAIIQFVKHGFAYLGMKTIVTDVVRENNQTYRLGWSEQCKDATKMGVGMPEYLLIFRKPPTDSKRSYADNPVVKLKRKYSRSRWQIDAHGFTRSNGNRLLTPEEIQNMPHAAIFKLFREFSLRTVYDFEHHVHLGEALEHYSVNRGLCKCDPPEKCRHGRLPVTFMLLQPPSWHPDVWTDITRMLTLNGAQSAKGREPHICPMQFDLADRVIAQYTEEGETVLDPFSGLCTVPYRAIRLKRKAIGIELALPYLLDGAKYCEAAVREVGMPTLFDMDPVMEEPETPRGSVKIGFNEE